MELINRFKRRINGSIGRGLSYSLKNHNNFDEQSLEHFIFDPIYHIKLFILGGGGNKKFQEERYKKLISLFPSDNPEQLKFNDIILPKPVNELDSRVFLMEFGDLLYPELCASKELLKYICEEGPYEIDENVSVKGGASCKMNCPS